MKDVQNHIVPSMTHWLSRNFFAFFPATGELADKFDTWLHVDDAYGGSGCICPEFRQYFDGIE